MPDADLADLRRRLRAARRTLSPAAQRSSASAVTSRLRMLPVWTHAEVVALYAATDGEVDTGLLAAAARRANKTITFPVIDGDDLVFAVGESFVPGPFAIPEPSARARRIPLHEHDLVCAPVVAVDRQRNRLGRGRGFYDRALGATARGAPVVCAVAHELQLVENLASHERDVPVDIVVTPSATIGI